MASTARRLEIVFLLAVLALASSVSGAADSALPAGWNKAGSHPTDYEMGLDTASPHKGRASAYVRAKVASPGFGTLMQTADAREYLGKRVRLAAYVKSEKVASWAGVWLRIDGSQGSTPLAFDNMQSRPIKGTTPWTRCEIVLDVPRDARSLNFGILLAGDGTVWFDSLSFEVVGTDVPVTSTPGPDLKPLQNLGFD